jgi:hypothetical protein
MSDKLDKEDEELINSVFERIEELDTKYEKDRQTYLQASKEEKLKLMQNELNYLVGLFAYHGQFRGTNALEELADYEQYEKRYFSEVDNKEENYIAYLKCYCNAYNNAALCCDYNTQDDIDSFIKQKCKEVNLEDVYESYHNAIK